MLLQKKQEQNDSSNDDHDGHHTINNINPASNLKVSFKYQRTFDEAQVIKELKKFLPAQAPLKDFIFQNTLKAFQHLSFEDALRESSAIFGYQTFLSLTDFRNLYQKGEIKENILNKIIGERKGIQNLDLWKKKLLTQNYSVSQAPRVGQLRKNWKTRFNIDLDARVHQSLFMIACSFLDQGISIWNFPLWKDGFLMSVKQMETNSFTSFFKTDRVRKLFLETECNIENLLKLVVGDEERYQEYLFDQQFAHPGWSGMISVIEDQPHTLMDIKKISLKEFITLELLFEIDALEFHFKGKWEPLCSKVSDSPLDLFNYTENSEQHEINCIWQEAYEWSYYDEVLAGIKMEKREKTDIASKTFQALFCIDDRETSLRDYLELTDPLCGTFATPGFFNVEFYFQPENGNAYTKLCPAPVVPKFLIKEIADHKKREEKDFHFDKKTHSLFAGMVISPFLGIWSAVRLVANIFNPSMSPSAASSFKHMDKVSKLTIENKSTGETENGLQVGFTVEEMTERVEGLLKSVGLVKDFSRVIYMMGHGASSVNNPFYASMDCGACSCRPGSVNARAFCFMANHQEVRSKLKTRGIDIPDNTQFIGGLHDTTRDEVVFYDEDSLSEDNLELHKNNLDVFYKALDLNAKERSRRFASIETKNNLKDIHKKIKKRSVSLFEPRPELDHANNALTIIGRRELSKGLFLDKRAFMNSYDYSIDPDGKYLINILKAAAPVCGGINLAYYFSRVDNQKLGAGTKLPHNVMGLFGVANGIDGDLRPGLPSQMVELHDPVRQLFIVEHFPEVVLAAVKAIPETYEWFINNWIHLVAVHPDTKEIFYFNSGNFVAYKPLTEKVNTISDINMVLESTFFLNNIPVKYIS